MSIELLKSAVAEIIASPNCAAEFFFLLKKKDGFVIKRADMNQDVQQELGEEFLTVLRSQVAERNEVSLLDISRADERSNVIYQYDLDPLPEQLQKLPILLASKIDQTFDFAVDRLIELEAILVLIGNQDAQLVIYKHHYPVTLLQKKTGFSIKRLKNSNRFERLDEDILKISPKFEVFWIGGKCYVLDVPTLARLYGFEEAIKNAAIVAIERVTASALVEDTAVLTARMNDLSFCRKLARLAKQSPVLGVIKNASIIEFVTQHPKLSGKFSLNEDKTKFLLKTKVSQSFFLKLMNDDYLRSLLTRTEYDALAKDNLLEKMPREIENT